MHVMPRHSALQGILHVPRRGVLHKPSCADEFALNMGGLDGGDLAFDGDGCGWGGCHRYYKLMYVHEMLS